MKAAIISDTHDNTLAVSWIIDYLNQEEIALAFHAGDLINPGVIRRFRDHYHGHLHVVLGNNDGEVYAITKIATEANNITCYGNDMDQIFDGKSIWMNHYSSNVETIAKLESHDICIGGHDHMHRIIKHGKSLFINPGNTVTKDAYIAEHEKESSFVVLDLTSLETQKVIVPH